MSVLKEYVVCLEVSQVWNSESCAIRYANIERGLRPMLHVYVYYISDPEISRALDATDPTHEGSVILTWSIGNTSHIDMIQLYQREIDESGSPGEWLPPINTSSTSSHTVRSLRPGTKYEFRVQIQSYGKTARTDIATVSTRKTTLDCWSWSQPLVVIVK